MDEEVAALGPYFGVEFHDSVTASATPWRPMSELIEVPGAFAERVAGVRAFLAAGSGQNPAAVEPRVAASVVHLGLCARVLSPLLALAVLHRRVGRVRVADLRWQPALGSMFPLSVRADALDSGAAFAEGVLGGVVGEFSAAAAGFGVNAHILRGNVASALAGAARTLVSARPDRRSDVSTLIAELLAGSFLSGSGHFEPAGTFRRHSCCLIYRAAPDRRGGLCGDCVLAAARGPMAS